jgi:DNA polymerase
MTHSKRPPQSAAPFVPHTHKLETLRLAARHCEGCELYKRATHVVFGEGSIHARIVLVGEQPGDKEDLSGHPFVGPSGELLHKALDEAGLGSEEIYVTNAVKHFYWVPSGKRRLHKSPALRHIKACKPWLEAELGALHPELVVCLGATAARAVFGRTIRVLSERGKILKSPFFEQNLITVHPSSILRSRSPEEREIAFRAFVEDFKKAARVLKQTSKHEHRTKTKELGQASARI